MLLAMNSITSHLTRFAAPAAMAAAAALGVGGVINATHDQSSTTTTVGIEHVSLGGFGLSLILLVPAVLYLGRLAGRPRFAAASSIGMTVLGLLTVVSNVRGSDPSFFGAVAVPTNLAWLVGYVAIAISLKRRRAVPTAIAIGLPVSWFFTIPLGSVGGTIVAGAYWLVVGWMLAHGELTRGAVPQAA